MTTTTKTTTTTELRRGTGSARFGIEPHDAAIGTFPKQPSQKDGLGRMCQEHWRVYTSGLRRDAQARKADEATTKAGASTEPTTSRSRKRSTARPPADAVEAKQAEILIAVVDAMPTDQMVKRVGDADVQAALETSAAARMLAD